MCDMRVTWVQIFGDLHVLKWIYHLKWPCIHLNISFQIGKILIPDIEFKTRECHFVTYDLNYFFFPFDWLIGAWGVGLATKKCNLSKVPLGNDIESWVLRSDGTVAHNGTIRHRLRDIPEEGDMIVSNIFFVLQVHFYTWVVTWTSFSLVSSILQLSLSQPLSSSWQLLSTSSL